MQRIIVESSPLFIILCAAVAIGLSYLLYKAKHPWGQTVNRLLFACRAILIFLLSLLLLGIIVKQVTNRYDKPVMVLLQDNSLSVAAVLDSTKLKAVKNNVEVLQKALEDKGYEVEQRQLNDKDGLSDFTKAFKSITNDYESKKLDGLVFVSDGIYNEGLSPLNATFNFPIHSLAMGDTVQRTDIFIRNIEYNKIAFEGNRFPIVVEINAKGFENQTLDVSLFLRGKKLETKSISVVNENLTTVEFLPTASEQGIQRYEIVVTPKKEEWNNANNKATAFVEIIAGKKKILAVATAPHPDIKALRTVIDQNPNYEFNLYIPGIIDGDFSKLQAEADLILIFQTPDIRGRNRQLLSSLMKTKASFFIITGEQTDWQELAKTSVLTLEQLPRQFDEVTPSLNSTFTTFILEDEVATIFNTFPPASVPFSRFRISPTATPLLFQKVGSVVTNKPLLFTDLIGDRKVAVMMGEGLWRWRLQEYSRNENTAAFDELFGKLIQYLSTTDDRRKFRSYPIQQQFSDTESVVFESQAYNDIFEPIVGNTVEIELTSEAGKKTNYRYTTSAGSTRYSIGGLPEGVYKYKATTVLKAKEEVRGEFLVKKQQVELQNLTADFTLLRRLSQQTGGHFNTVENYEALKNELLRKEAIASIHSEEKYDPLVNLKWLFFLLVAIIGLEWFLRKYYGSY